jgi:peptide/nickel transport system ATP-binding protein
MLNNTVLEVKHLGIGFQTEDHIEPVIHDIHFRIQRGETFALVGESGSGKSVTALSIMQLLPAAARVKNHSQIILEQDDLLKLSEIQMRHIRGRRIGMIFQEAMAALNPVLTIGEQINEVLKCHFSLANSQRRDKILSLLEDVGIKDPPMCSQSYPHQLSGGMKQRAMIAMALAAEPGLLIADEPTTALDVTIQAQILELLRNIQKNTAMSLLFITHDLGVVAKIADRIAVMQKGKIVEQAKTDDFFAQPQHLYSRQLLNAIPSWRNREREIRHVAVHEQPELKVESLKVYFPIRKGVLKRTVGYIKAVDDVTFSLYEGQTLALVGESGSGKTTTGKGILRLTPPTSGKIQYEEQLLADLNAKVMHQMRGKLQIIFQDPYASMNPRMTVAEIIEEGMAAQNIGRSALERRARIDELLELVGLKADHKFRYPHEFSGGQRQRICIARALAVQPKIIICDEPTSSLDVTVQMQILKLLLQLQKKSGLAYLLITHDFSVVAYLADEVAVMYQGKIVEHGPVEHILHTPQHSYTQKLLASVPKIKDLL